MSENSVDTRAVPAVPFYMSQANQEFLGTTVGNISASMYAAGVPVPGYVSALAGKASSTHTVTVGFASGAEDYEYGCPWQAYGFNDGSRGHDYVAGPVAYGGMNPITLNIPEASVTQVVNWELFDSLFIDWYGEGVYEPEWGYLYTSFGVFGNRYTMTIEFPNGAVHIFKTPSPSTDSWYEETSGFANTMRSYNGQTIGITITIEVFPYTQAEADALFAEQYVAGLTPPGVTDALYFIDPLMFPNTGEIRAFPRVANRDAIAPMYTQEVPKPPMGYVPGSHDFVNGEWVLAGS